MADLKDEAVQEQPELEEKARPSPTTELTDDQDVSSLSYVLTLPAGEARETYQIGDFLAPPPFPRALEGRWRKAGALALLLLALTVGDLGQDLAFNALEKPARLQLDAAYTRVQLYRAQRAVLWQRALQAVTIVAPPRVFAGEPWTVRLKNDGGQPLRMVAASWQDEPAEVYLPPLRAVRMNRTFARPGWRTLTFSLNNSRQHRNPVRVYVRPPLRPGKVPVALPPGLTLSRNPQDWHLVLNIYYDEHQPEQNTVYFRGEVIQRFLISTGTEGHPTPIGRWWVVEKRLEPWSTLYHVPMPYWSGLSNGWSSGLFGLHTLTDAYFQNYLGGPASHGCIRHAPQAAMWLYENVPIGATVDIIARLEKQG